MDRDEVKELHFITSIDNLGSIMIRGILSHNRVGRIQHKSVAYESVQDRRRGKSVPGGSSLHSYANLYFHARNSMMYCLQGLTDLVVIRVSSDVLDIPDSVITDGNAATWNTRFYPSPEGLSNLDSKLVFARYWTDSDYWTYVEKKRARNAEVLVPKLVPSRYIEGCYVDTQDKHRACLMFRDLPAVDVRKEIFFK
jgi:hypothetical protein